MRSAALALLIAVLLGGTLGRALWQLPDHQARLVAAMGAE